MLLSEVPAAVTSPGRVTCRETEGKCGDLKSNTVTAAFKKSDQLIYLINLVKLVLFYIHCWD